MDWPAIVLAILGISAAIATVLTPLLNRGRNTSAVKSMQLTLDQYKITDQLKDQQLTAKDQELDYLKNQLYDKDQIIKVFTNARKKNKNG